MLLASLLLTAVGCRQPLHSAPTTIPDAELTPQACLEELDLNNLDQALKRCNQIVAAHESNPAPLLRIVLLLPPWAGMDQACLDVDQALRLVKRQGAKADPMINHELTRCVRSPASSVGPWPARADAQDSGGGDRTTPRSDAPCWRPDRPGWSAHPVATSDW